MVIKNKKQCDPVQYSTTNMWCRQLTAQATTAIKTTVQQAAATIVGHHTTTTHYNITSTKIIY